MGGGLMQLVAYGAQDIYLTGNPQITFFQVVYRKHTNFSIESFEQTFIGSVDFGKKVDVHVTRNGDLLHRLYIEHEATVERKTLDANHNIGHVENYGHSLIKQCDIQIGGQKIDRHTSLWSRVWSDLTEYNPDGHLGGPFIISDSTPMISPPDTSNSTGTQYQLMTGNGMACNTDGYNSTLNQMGLRTGTDRNGFNYTPPVDAGSVKAKININKIFIPLNFWFCRESGLALPLVALQYHEVKLIFEFEEFGKLFRVSDTANFGTDGAITRANMSDLTVTSNFTLWGDYVYLDTDERRRFAEEDHEYLIDQLQISQHFLNKPSNNIELKFSHPVKELIWVVRNETVTSSETAGGGRNQGLDTSKGDWTASPVSVDDFEGKWLLKLNNHDRFKERETKYFTKTQVNQHHTGYGSVAGVYSRKSDLSGGQFQKQKSSSIAVYSFALNPEDHQPSGASNLSRIDNVVLESSDFKVWSIGSTLNKYVTVGETGATNLKLTVFAVNYNILRIMSGMGGLAYSN